MNTKQLLMGLTVSAIALSAPPADAIGFRPLVVTQPGGEVRLQQGLPCGPDLDITRKITGGRIEVAFTSTRLPPTFSLTKMDLFLEPFSVRRKCKGGEAVGEFYEVGVQLAGAVSFDGVPTGVPESNQYLFRIPKEKFLLYESILDNAPVRQPETTYQKPSQDVTGVLDLRNGTIEIHVALGSRLRFRAGCLGKRCVIDEEQPGVFTADIVGRLALPNADSDSDGVPDAIDNCPGMANPSQAPDQTAPTVACQAVTSLKKSFRASAVDTCSPRVALRLGSFMLDNGEVIEIHETGQAGVRLMPPAPGPKAKDVRQFQVGRGEAFITATDAAGNSANAACR